MIQMQSKRVLYILSGNLSTTPRALQSIREAIKSNSVTTIGVNRDNKWFEFDRQLVKEFNLDYETVSLSRDNYFMWLKTALIHKFYSLIYPYFNQSITIAAYASSKVHILMWNRLKNENRKYDLIIGHSGSSLYPVWKYAKLTKIPFIFDVEDYHPGEYIPTDRLNEKLRREFLLKNLLPEAYTITVASPLIAERIKIITGIGSIKNLVLLNNCFPSTEFEYIEPGTGPLSVSTTSTLNNSKIQFVWFSQNIAANRGLELVIPELAKFKSRVHLHLIGSLDKEFSENWIEPNHQFISTYKPLPQKELNHLICQFDIGLALELASADENRQICLTNKAWAYLQAGLFIVATNTKAQLAFMKDHAMHGWVTCTDQISENNEDVHVMNISDTISKIIENYNAIQKSKKERFEKARQYSWENERAKLLQVFGKIIKN